MNNNKTLRYIHDELVEKNNELIKDDPLSRASVIYNIYKENTYKIHDILTGNKKFVKEYVLKLEEENRLNEQRRLINTSFDYNEPFSEEDFKNDKSESSDIANLIYNEEKPKLLDTSVIPDNIYNDEWSDVFKYLLNKLKENNYNFFVNSIYRSLSCYLVSKNQSYIEDLNGFIDNYNNSNNHEISSVSEAEHEYTLITITVHHNEECYNLVNNNEVVKFIDLLVQDS